MRGDLKGYTPFKVPYEPPTGVIKIGRKGGLTKMVVATGENTVERSETYRSQRGAVETNTHTSVLVEKDLKGIQI